MAEYYAVLSKAVAGLEPSSPESRRAVYDKARNALIGQLKAIDPPLPTAEISRQRLELEEAIRRVERETAGTAPRAPQRPAARPEPAPAAAPAAAAAVPPPPRPAAAAPPSAATPRPAAQAPRPSPQDIFRRAIQNAERDDGDEPRVERAAVPAAKVDTSWASERVDRIPPPARPAETFLPSQGYVEETHNDEPRLAPDYDQGWDHTIPVPPLGDDSEHDAEPVAPARGRRSRRAPRAGDAERAAAPVRKSRLPLILLLILIVAMVGGIGALAWSQREILADLASGLGGSDTGAPAATETAPTADATPVVDDSSGKDTGRLLEGGEPAPAQSDVRVVAPADGGNADPIAGQLASAEPEAPPAAAVTGTPQRAVLYEEPLDTAAAAAGVIAINATVTWSYLPNGINGPEIVGNLEVPERGMKIKVAIRRNTDPTLPASHIVEVVADTPADFPAGGIRDVPRIVFKPSEDARGQPLIGASARVAPGFFWIALSGIDSDVQNNLALLKERIWIDLPLIYQSGQRAILTMEKGESGQQVFQTALSAWTG